MAFDKKLVSDSVVQRLIEAQSIYQLTNRSFDGLVRQGASSVDVPKLPTLIAKTTGSTGASGDRKKMKAGTLMVNVPLVTTAIPVAGEVYTQFESNGMLLTEFTKSAAMTFSEKFDEAVLVEAMSTTDVEDFASSSLGWADITAMNAKLDANKVPKSDRVIIIGADVATEFFAIDVVKNAVGYQSQLFQNGQLISLLGMRFFISGLLPKVTVAGTPSTQHAAVLALYGPGLAFILAQEMDIKEAYDSENLQTNMDFLSFYGVKLFDAKFSVVRYKP